MTKEPLLIGGLPYRVLILDEHMKIGCQLRSIKEWEAITDREILKMDGKEFVKLWKKWKMLLLQMGAVKR